MTDLTRARELIRLAQELDAKATIEPWYSTKYVPAPGGGEVHYRIQHQPEIVVARAFGDSLGDMQDASFIAASRTAWPETARLLAEQIAATEAAEAKLASAEKVVEAARVMRIADKRLDAAQTGTKSAATTAYFRAAITAKSARQAFDDALTSHRSPPTTPAR